MPRAAYLKLILHARRNRRTHGYAARAAEQMNHEHRKCKPVDLIRRSPPQLITANRETDFTAGDAGERRGYPKMEGERYALHLLRTAPARYDPNSDSILRPCYGRDQ